MNSVHRAGRILGWTAAWAIAIVSAAQADDELFPRPAELEPAVQFWTRVYTEIDTHSGFIHDSLRLDIVYQTVHFTADMTIRDRRRRVERLTDLHRNILNKLASGDREGLNGEEERVLALFPSGTSNAEFRAAAGRLRFQLGQADRFRAGLIRSGAWKSFIFDVLDKEGLPRELAALPHVESSFDPTAYSKVGAAGLWQFTRSTGVRYMRIDHIVDERRDPFLATKAAARLLADNHSVVETWPLALTAYNHGLAGMRRAIDQQRTTDIATIVAKYESRSFGFASRNFYTAFLAALEIDQHPDRYFSNLRLDPPSPDRRRRRARVHARRYAGRRLEPASQHAARAEPRADRSGVGGRQVRAGRVRAPRAGSRHGLGRAAACGHRAQASALPRSARIRSTACAAATLCREIAAEYRVSLAALMRVNGLTGRDMIRVGQTIKLPIDGATAKARAAEEAVVVARAEPDSDRPTPAIAAVAIDGEHVYVVRNGDSIERISKRLGVDADALLAANSIAQQEPDFRGPAARGTDGRCRGDGRQHRRAAATRDDGRRTRPTRRRTTSPSRARS